MLTGLVAELPVRTRGTCPVMAANLGLDDDSLRGGLATVAAVLQFQQVCFKQVTN